MTTAERALELAKLFKPMPGAKVSFTLGDGAANEVEAILRHYAEILPKYEAIMAAEPVAEVVKIQHGLKAITSVTTSPGNLERLNHGAQLIIKPEPKA